jgi:hypothetical protein
MTNNSEQMSALPQRLLTSAETATILGLKSPNTLAVWRCTKRYPELSPVKIGRMVRYHPAVVAAFLRQHTDNDR